MRFQGTDTYIATDDLKLAVNAALALERPLLVKGEPGTGKTLLAEEVARSIGRPLFQWHIKSTTKAQQGLYEYDAVSRLRDSQLGDEHVADIAHYIKRGVLWDAFQSDGPAVVLIDEIDKADIEFPNDLLRELDRMEFHVYETQQTIHAQPSAAGRHHQQQREGAAGRVPAPMLLPLHPLSRSRDDDAHRRRAFPRAEEGAAARGARGLLQPARGARAQEEAVDLRAARLAQGAAGRGHSAGSASQRQTGRRSSRRCTARCSRTSRTCTCSSGSCSWRGRDASEAVRRAGHAARRARHARAARARARGCAAQRRERW